MKIYFRSEKWKKKGYTPRIINFDSINTISLHEESGKTYLNFLFSNNNIIVYECESREKVEDILDAIYQADGDVIL